MKYTQEQLDKLIDACDDTAAVFCNHHTYYANAVIEISEHCELIMFDKKNSKFVEKLAVALANDEIHGMYHPEVDDYEGTRHIQLPATPGYDEKVSYEVAPASLMELALGKKLDFSMKAVPVDGEVDGEDMMNELAGILAKSMVPYMLRHCRKVTTKKANFLADMGRLYSKEQA